MTAHPNALISVSDKTHLIKLCVFLIDHHFKLYATSSTYKYLLENKIDCQSVESLTNFPEILDGRVKTLHPKIFGGILCRQNLEKDHNDLMAHNIHPFSLVVCNLYPFEEVSKRSTDTQELIENIDIGGVSLLRAAAKNYQFVTTLSEPHQYAEFLKKYTTANKTELNLQFALQAFQKTAQYDQMIFESLTSKLMNHKNTDKNENQKNKIDLPEKITLQLLKSSDLRYGENPHQKAAIYDLKNLTPNSISIGPKENIIQLHGKELSFNNWLDIDHALKLTKELDSIVRENLHLLPQKNCDDIPRLNRGNRYSCVIVKHNTPCGVGLSSFSLKESFENAFAGDTISPFGGIVSLNCVVGTDLAEILSNIFLEVIIATNYTQKSLDILQKKKNIRLMKKLDPVVPAVKPHDRLAQGDGQLRDDNNMIEFKAVNGQFLIQTADNTNFDLKNYTTPTIHKPTDEQLRALNFANAIVKHVRSNAIVITNSHQTIAIAGGFTNRVDAVKNCLQKATLSTKNAVLASDAFFPFADSIELLKDSGICAVIEPGGSLRDTEVIQACDKFGLALVFSGIRHFKH